jgi:hypothetical protein
MQRDAVNELFGLAGTFPRPGWVVLDAARDHRFTGELQFDTSPPVRVYFDRGHIYLAERVTDPSLGARLVDAGALSAVQLERGSVRVGEIEHLGRLFERVPGLDRHTVIVTAELMTEECVGWLAGQRVPEVDWTPYRHHESGMHQWTRAPGWVDLTPGDPLPAPPSDEAPLSVAPPAASDLPPVVEQAEAFLDGLVEWDEPSWLDGSQFERDLGESLVEPPVDRGGDDRDDEGPSGTGEQPTEPGVVAPAAAGDESTDWVDRLVLDGLPEVDPSMSPKPLPRLPTEPVDRFELVWPSGEIDEAFGAVESVVGSGHDPDADRIGASARLARPSTVGSHEPTSASALDALSSPGAAGSPASGRDAETTDEVVLAVRRAVASIEVGSLAARQRLVDTSGAFGAAWRGGVDPDDTGGVPAPGRVAVRSGRNDWSRRTVTRSVFDEPAVEPAPVEPEPVSDSTDHRERRAGALRRLITSLRR